MKHNPWGIVKEFEEAIADYAGAPYAVAVSSCTEALMLSCAYHFKEKYGEYFNIPGISSDWCYVPEVTIPKRTYVGVPQSIINAGGRVKFVDDDWKGAYLLRPYPIWDSAKWLTSGIWKHLSGKNKKIMVCISLHWAKTLPVGWGGVILHGDKKADKILRKMRFDGRTEGVKPKDDTFDVRGYHCIMSPAQAAEALTRLSFLPRHNNPLPNDDYADLSKVKIFQ